MSFRVIFTVKGQKNKRGLSLPTLEDAMGWLKWRTSLALKPGEELDAVWLETDPPDSGCDVAISRHGKLGWYYDSEGRWRTILNLNEHVAPPHGPIASVAP